MQSANGPDLGNPPSKQQQPSPAQQQQQAQQPPQQWVAHHPQQQWMAAMQYPAAAMVMMQQQMMMYPQHYMPYNHPHHPAHQFHYSQYPHPHHHHQQQQQQQQPQQQQGPYQQQQLPQQQPQGSAEEVKTIWVGDLLHWMDETYLHSCFSHTGEVSSVKVIRNKQTGQTEGYGFVEFFSRAAAEKVLQSYNGSVMPNTDQPFRLNWASFSAGDRRAETSSDLSIFVGDLAPDVTDTLLHETFASRYPSVKGAKVVFDSNTGRSKGYGFVRFADENERSRSITEMNGVYCSSRAMRIGVATPKKAAGHQQQYSSQALVLAGGHASNGSMAQGSQSDGEPNNATIFVGGLDSDVSDDELRQPFCQFGEVVSVKIPVGKGCGFVQFTNRKNAEDAMQSLNGTVIGKQTVRLSWGRSPGNKQWRADPNNQWNGGHHRSQSYGYGYGYAVPPNQDPSMYAAATAVPGAS
ncbi:polyadenylate-binding protein RBP47B [Carica papaya]|uniref:polyadenylate-binding protein RBP47B n=1 Tax=Carica papaya TaxID=3649 RepID=UPI000B8D03BC|nr:polyadenylate-binding protein RBP47B [Carica papaya]